MELTKDEKQTLRLLVQEKLKEFRGEEIKRDVPVKFLKAEEDYENFLETLLKKFE
jgi:hypothetical protein